ncbi:putative transporter [Cyphellophora attinorum]|uniref:Putative transporter n=1 Tax=Cyphellophora attinorum TaxID=1664694 RepID=A0A0N1H3S7_9EURO|nr:putative transporter [Phialophora attinorum]KPI35146.1 putative transporter [Phialophora attinorum]
MTTAPSSGMPCGARDTGYADSYADHDRHEGQAGSSSSAAAAPRSRHLPHLQPKQAEDGDHDDDDVSNASVPPTPSFPPPHRSNTLSKSYTPSEESSLVRKLDRNLTLFLSLLYLLSFLDRSNIGNARIAGLSTSLDLTSAQYSSLLTAFYITYILFEPLILCYKFLPARWYIPACVVAWGVVASCQATVTRYGQLVVLRGMLGVTEAAFGPGVPFYMTFFYRRRELAYRVGLQVSAAPLATSFASLLAWGIVWVNERVGIGGVESWRVLFLVEGFPSVLVGVWALWWVPDGPGSARWLSVRERRVAVLRLVGEGGSGSEKHTSTAATSHMGFGSRTTTFLRETVNTLRDPKCYLTALMFFSVNVSFASLPVFLPTIVNDMRFSPVASQALAAPPYLCAFGFVLLVGHYSDKISDSRGIFLCLCAGMSSLAYFVIAIVGAVLNTDSTLSIVLRYASVYPAAMGLFSSVVLIITWTLNNQESSSGKGVAMTLLNVLGQCGPLVGVRAFPDGDAPGFVRGMCVCGSFMAGVVGLSVLLRWWLGRLNRKGGGAGNGGEMEMRERLMGGDGDGDKEEDDLKLKEVSRREEERFAFML